MKDNKVLKDLGWSDELVKAAEETSRNIKSHVSQPNVVSEMLTKDPVTLLDTNQTILNLNVKDSDEIIII